MGGTFDFIKAPVYHLGYAEELNKLKEARNKNLIQTNYEDNPSDPENILNYCAMCWDDPQVPDLLRQVLQSGSNHQSYNAGSKLLTWMDDKGVALPDEKNIELSLLEIHARSGIVNLRRGRRFFAESKVDEALNCYQIAYEGMQFEILERLPREEILERLGLLYAMNKNLDKACETFREWELAFGRSLAAFTCFSKLYLHKEITELL